MCGIFGYAGFATETSKKRIADILVNGLKRIEYRGYDSAGICITDDSDIQFVRIRTVGKVECLAKAVHMQSNVDLSRNVKMYAGIAHTRWATHGQPSLENSHPLSSDKDNHFLVVHNGIITNYKQIRASLEKKGFVFESSTDTECAAKLAMDTYMQMKKENESVKFVDVIKNVVRQCDGAFAFVFVSSCFPNEMVIVRKSSPVLIGLKPAEDVIPKSIRVVHDAYEDVQLGNAMPLEVFVSSDACALVEHTRNIVYLEDGDIAHVSNGNVLVHRLIAKENDTTAGTREVKAINMELSSIMKGEYDHYMIKEINEQKDSVIRTMAGRIDFDAHSVFLEGLKDYIDAIRSSQRIVFIACGTSYYACLSCRALFEELTGVPVAIEMATDFIDRRPPVSSKDAVLIVSQSGETADSAMAMRYCLQKDALCIGITNTIGSAISRETACGVHINAGPEIGVASTKAYTSQCITLVLIALQLSEGNTSHTNRRNEIIEGLRNISSQIDKVLLLNESVRLIANGKIKDCRSLLVIGRGYQYPTCLEGALKIKEITYIHSEGLAAGELKHGPIALVDDELELIFIAANDSNYDKARNAMEQIRARNGNPMVICTEDVASDYSMHQVLAIPKTVDCLQGVLAIIPLQLLSYHLAVAKGHDPDFPRSLAKSVTVE
ncbi:SIS domain-containing protein [Ordospora pajunii]|uniref:SIS domain-containing protein n=1 Tax=Ordospora pajunii TaxID=3039483 RepID=UPI0029528C31|nr:SIS domain-containing protein [Ordospora pajunii]KAH9411093.1 SIS domain-containing protein [Ordospora pajunii]